MAETRQERRYTFLKVFSMLMASALAVLVGLFALAGQMATAMSVSGAVIQGSDQDAGAWVLLAFWAGPFIAAGSLILGWLVFIARMPGLGIRLVFFPPVIWAVGFLSYFAIVSTFCDGHLTCGF